MEDLFAAQLPCRKHKHKQYDFVWLTARAHQHEIQHQLYEHVGKRPPATENALSE